MIVLGYTDFVTQGGDFGHVVRYHFRAVLDVALMALLSADTHHSQGIWTYARESVSHEYACVS